MSRYENFTNQAQQNRVTYAQETQGSGSFDYVEQVEQLIRLSNNINVHLLTFLFGERIGRHLTEKYVDCNRNLLVFQSMIDSKYRFFILHELKTNEVLFAHC